VRSASTPLTLTLKFETYLEKEKFMLLRSTTVIFRVVLAPSSFEKRASKDPCVSRVVDTKEFGKCSFR
jgi:hypothetical protein